MVNLLLLDLGIDAVSWRSIRFQLFQIITHQLVLPLRQIEAETEKPLADLGIGPADVVLSPSDVVKNGGPEDPREAARRKRALRQHSTGAGMPRSRDFH